MSESASLTIGQKAVVDAYLANYEPADTFNPDVHILRDTQTMIMEMDSMCLLGSISLSDYLAEKGYRAHYIEKDCVNGWILHPKNK